jgi:hypothetical protein
LYLGDYNIQKSMFFFFFLDVFYFELLYSKINEIKWSSLFLDLLHITSKSS